MENTTQLTVTDLANVHQLIDAAASRGAFKAAEMQQVGEIYNKLTAFLTAVSEQQQTAQSQSEDQAAAPADPESPQPPQGEKNA